jgi:hypothetical protein
MDAINDFSARLGRVEGRLDSVEARVDRHENFVGAAIRDVNTTLATFGAELRSGQSNLAGKIDGIEAKLDREEGARIQAASDKQAKDEKFWNAEQLRVAWWGVVMCIVGSVVGALIETHFHLLGFLH